VLTHEIAILFVETLNALKESELIVLDVGQKRLDLSAYGQRIPTLLVKVWPALLRWQVRDALK
jgi:hypothetical protein